LKPIDTALCLSGGGITSTVFSAGAIKCMVDHHLLEHINVISATSGGTIVLTLLELCYERDYHKEHDWVNKYLRNALYELLDGRFLSKVLMWISSWDKNKMFVSDPDRKRPTPWGSVL
jgi:hypothetical protein